MTARDETANQDSRAVTRPAENSQYLTFMLDDEMFGITIRGIKEIIEYAGVTTVPMMPECICGVINLRGAVVPVMDLSSRFGRGASIAGKRTCVIIVEINDGDRQLMGVLVDVVNAVLDIPAKDIEPAPPFGARICPSYIQGIGKVNGRFVILLNISLVLAVETTDMPAIPD